MNLDIFYDEIFYTKLDDLFFIYERNPIYPFEEFHFDPNNLVGPLYDATDLYNFLNKVNFLYLLDQQYVGIVEIDGIEYIIDVDTECNISILGDNEINWTKCFFGWREDEEWTYLEFKNFFEQHYKTTFNEPDYEKFGTIERKHHFF
jgi:hypothetical protein